MTGLNNWEYTNLNGRKNFHFVNFDELNLTLEEVCPKFGVINDFISSYKITMAEFISHVKKLGILERSLFDFSIFKGKDNILIEENGVYTQKALTDSRGHKYYEKTYHNVYLSTAQYIELDFNEIAQSIFKVHYPELYQNPFIIKEARFTDELKQRLSKITEETSIDDIAFTISDVKIKDIIELVKNPDYLDDMMDKSRISIYNSKYQDPHIFLDISDSKKTHKSIFFHLSDFCNKDWKSVEERDVFSMPLYDENGVQIKGRWFNGKQKDYPYFNHPLVEMVKKLYF